MTGKVTVVLVPPLGLFCSIHRQSAEPSRRSASVRTHHLAHMLERRLDHIPFLEQLEQSRPDLGVAIHFSLLRNGPSGRHSGPGWRASGVGAGTALFPFIERIFADAGYQGPKTAAVMTRTGRWAIEIVKRSEMHNFVVLPKRWIVERTLAWISRNRRLSRDFERHATTTAAFVRLAMIRIMLRRLARTSH